MKSNAKYVLIPIGLVVPLWYILLFAASWVQSNRPKTYGEDLSGFGVLALPLVAVLTIVPALALGSLIYFVFWLVRKDQATAAVWAILCCGAYWVISIPVLAIMSIYITSDF